MAVKQQARKPVFAEESIESKGGISSGVKSEGKKLSQSVVDSFWNDLLAGSFKSSTEQVVKKATPKSDHVAGELKIGEEMSLKKREDKLEEEAELKALKNELHRDYYKEDVEGIEIKASREQEYSRNQQVEEIKIEIKRLIKSSKQMEIAFKDVASQIDSPIEKPGTYHLNFLDWVLMTMRSVRASMEEGVSWAKTLSNKRAEKKYWNMAKKNGTTFSLSQERTTATQTG